MRVLFPYRYRNVISALSALVHQNPTDKASKEATGTASVATLPGRLQRQLAGAFMQPRGMGFEPCVNGTDRPVAVYTAADGTFLLMHFQ